MKPEAKQEKRVRSRSRKKEETEEEKVMKQTITKAEVRALLKTLKEYEAKKKSQEKRSASEPAQKRGKEEQNRTSTCFSG